jgi:nucleotide-binding universal stress UspA family protein
MTESKENAVNSRTKHIVVGVVNNQPPAVLAAAATFAEHFNADLVCASVNSGRYTIGTRPDGTVVSLSIDPDVADETVEVFNPRLRSAIAAALEDRGVLWSARALAGGEAQELARLADTLDAAMIVVGTREPGFKGSLHEFFNGSVAAQLAHRQHRPVVVVPLSPVGLEGELPWDEEAP